MPEIAWIMVPTTSPSSATWPSISFARSRQRAPCASRSSGLDGRTHTSPKSSPKSEMRLPCRRILDQAPNGVSPIYTVDMIKQTEQELGRSLGAGDAVLYWSRYVDLYDLPGEAGNRLHIDPLVGRAPA